MGVLVQNYTEIVLKYIDTKILIQFLFSFDSFYLKKKVIK